MTAAIIVAAGSGTRMGNPDKLFLAVAGQPVVAHTWRIFDTLPMIDEIVLVVREGQESTFAGLAEQNRFRKPYKTVIGGKERQDSVWNGLQGLSSAVDLVAIHDGARPCTSPALIQATLDAARQNGAAVAAQRMSDTAKQSDDGLFISQHLDRAKLWSVQTPQCFRVDVIKRALSLVRERGMRVTDDTAACDLIGQAVLLVESNAPNPKVTIPEDLPYVDLLLRTEVQ
jgi:2-C-methyl-D-erythritol 4-phosphate cytidylyltransferase